jgi:hypothetical protein
MKVSKLILIHQKTLNALDVGIDILQLGVIKNILSFVIDALKI